MTTKTISQELLYLDQHQLKLHPNNMRRFYPPSDVEKMAGSIEASGGVLQALLVVPETGSETYLVVDGNMRLAGGRSLGAECPPLKCEVLNASQAEQYLIMAATSHHHYPKDPISEALHYKRLLDEEGYSIRQIAQGTGVADVTITSRLRLLDLDDEIQTMVGEGKLAKDRRLAEALLGVPVKEARIELAKRIAANPRLTIPAAQAAAARLAQSLGQKKAARKAPPITTVPKAFFTQFASHALAELATDRTLLEDCAMALEAFDIDEKLRERVSQRADRISQLLENVKQAKAVTNGSH